MSEDVRERFIAFLATRSHCATGRVGEDGYPVVQTIRYVPIGPNIYLSTRPTTAKLADIARDPRHGYAIVSEAMRGPELKAAEVKGRATVLLDGEERAQALQLHWDAYEFARFPGGLDNAVVKIEPISVSFRDHAQGPLHVETFAF